MISSSSKHFDDATVAVKILQSSASFFIRQKSRFYESQFFSNSDSQLAYGVICFVLACLFMPRALAQQKSQITVIKKESTVKKVETPIAKKTTIPSTVNSAAANEADVLFEGYHKIISGGIHVGYSISRYEYNSKLKQFKAIVFNKTGALGSDVTESTVATADENLTPLSYQYTALVGKDIKTIDAQFRKGHMSATVKDGKAIKKIEQDVPKDVYLSQFLVYLMLKSKNGLQADLNYHYKAIAEEDGMIYEGLALINKQGKFNGFNSYKVLNNFKDTKFVAYISDRGEVLGVTNPAQNMSSELMAKPSEAVGSFGVGASILKNLFGEVPLSAQRI